MKLKLEVGLNAAKIKSVKYFFIYLELQLYYCQILIQNFIKRCKYNDHQHFQLYVTVNKCGSISTGLFTAHVTICYIIHLKQ